MSRIVLCSNVSQLIFSFLVSCFLCEGFGSILISQHLMWYSSIEQCSVGERQANAKESTDKL
jgi:hypothetical protein